MPTPPRSANPPTPLLPSDGPRPDELRAAALRERLLRGHLLVDGVFEGGGALGTAYAGGLRALHDNDIWFKRVAGNSAGAITAAMIAVGFTAPEIEWLSSAFRSSPRVPPSLAAVGITQPIAFESFLDLPDINSISTRNKRKTLLWQALKGTLLDEIGRQPVPIPTQGAMVNKCLRTILDVPLLGDAIRAIPGAEAEDLLRDTLNVALFALPNEQLYVKDFMLDTESLRIALADTLWDAVMRNSPLMLMMTNLVHEGSIFEGAVFFDTIQTLFSRKVHDTPDGVVLFKDLAIPLAVIAADIDTGEMIVYSSETHPNERVAEAIRQSMSIPFIFEPRGRRKQFVDGGLYSNFPVWLYSAAGDRYWNPADIDHSRVKIGFSLDDTKRAPRTWDVQRPKFVVAGSPPHVDTLEAIRPVLIERLVEFGLPRELAESEITWALFGDTPSSDSSRPGIELLQEILGVVGRGVMHTEESTRKVTTEGLMHDLPYIDIPIPLLGFHAFDFYINNQKGPLLAMWDRAWRKTIEELLDASARNILPPTTKIANVATPFND